MDWYPLWNSLRIAAISCVLVFFLGIFFAYYAARLPRAVKGVLDVVLTLPMVLPPTVCGYFLLVLFGTKRPLGIFLQQFGIKFVMTWYGGVLAAAVVAFPLMYRTARGAFESFDETLAYSGKTLGLSNTYIFWRIRAAMLTGCKNIAAARKAGEYEVDVPEWGVRLQTAQPVGDGIKAVGIRAHYFNGKAAANRYPVEYLGEMEEPFEWIVQFRYKGQAPDAAPLWWRMPKDRRPQQFPECFGVAPANVMLLYQ